MIILILPQIVVKIQQVGLLHTACGKKSGRLGVFLIFQKQLEN